MSVASVLGKNAKSMVGKWRAWPLWKGPEVDGVTFSLLSRFLCCRERFRLKVIEGLEPIRTWNHRIGYGNMWHVCEGAMAAGADWLKGTPGLQHHCQMECKAYPAQQEQINHWYEVCKVQFPIYISYWSKHPDVISRTTLFQERVFNLPYKLPSGQTVRLRGKWDSVDLVKDGEETGVWLVENKTKGDIKELQIQRQLTFDLQTMFYVVALLYDKDEEGLTKNGPISGVRYNVVRRPLSGGKGTIVQHKPTKSNPSGESKEEFYDRLRNIIEESQDTYFMRWNVPIVYSDIRRFRHECLDPVLEQLCNWYVWASRPLIRGGTDQFDHEAGIHWRYPFGVYNPLDEVGSSDLDEYLATGSEIGLTRIDELFSELK